MPLRTLLVSALLGAGLLNPASASSHQSNDTGAASASRPEGSREEARYELGAVVDVRQPNPNGLTILAITPGGAADRLGLRGGDQLRAVNGRRLDGAPRPSSALASALQEGKGALRVEATRNGKPLVLAGHADIADPARQEKAMSCGYLSSSAGVVPQTKGIFHAEITQIDGRSTPREPMYRHRVKTGKHVLVVREFIDPNRLNSSQVFQISKMKKFALARAYKSIVVDVEPGMSYRIGARLLKDKLDAQSIRDNAYWEPVVWAKVPETCR